MNDSKGRLHLIPTPLGDYEPALVLPQSVLDLIPGLDCFVVEELRSARRFLSRAGHKGNIDKLEFHLLNEHSTPAEAEALLSLFNGGRNVGLISEAGLPAVADPGAALVALCHGAGIEVVPHCGPSSLMLALMGSGLNGQSFAFNGYLPAKTDARRQAIRNYEKTSASHRQTQIFIETPYRNDSLMQDLLQCLSGSTRLCIAADLTLPSCTLRTARVSEWKKDIPSIGKRPCVFLFLA